MERKQFDTRSIGLIAGVLYRNHKIDPNRVVPEARFEEDLGADSLTLVESIMALEDEFGLDVLDEDMARIKTVGQMLHIVWWRAWMADKPDPRVLIARRLGVPINRVVDAANFEQDLNASRTRRTRLLASFNAEYGLGIGIEEAATLTTVSQLLERLWAHEPAAPMDAPG